MLKSTTLEQISSNGPNYDLSEEELEELETRLIQEISTTSSEPDVYCVWTSANSPFADIVRTHEKKHWDYISSVMDDKDAQSKFLLVVDTRDGATAGVKRVTRITFANKEPDNESLTGMAIIDDIINSEQGLSLEEFMQYYNEKGVDISKCFSVETNIKVQKADRYNGLPLAEIGYLAMYKQIENSRTGGLAYIFATINQDSIDSFDLIDLKHERIAGHSDVATPTDDGSFDVNFIPVALPTHQHNLDIFRSIISMSAPELYVD